MTLLIFVVALLSALLPTSIALVTCSGSARCCPTSGPGGRYLQLQQNNQNQILCTYGRPGQGHRECGYHPAGARLSLSTSCPANLTPGNPTTPYCRLRYKIRSGVNANKCVEARDYSSGALVQIHDCNDNNRQNFLFYQNIVNQIRVAGTNYCLHVPQNSGSSVRIQTCNGADARQRWRYHTTTRRFEHASGFYLNLPNSDTTNGRPLNILPLNPGLRQIWRLY